jgi:hypothetical protein
MFGFKCFHGESLKDLSRRRIFWGTCRPSEAFQRYHLISTLLMVGYLEILQASGDVCDEDFDFEKEVLVESSK